MRIQRLLQKRRRLVAGLMSGTSVDGVDVALVDLEGSGTEISISVRHFESIPYEHDVREEVLAQSSAEGSNVYALSQLNMRLAIAYAAALSDVFEHAGVAAEDVDVVGSHGQTVHHVPISEVCAGIPVISTLQLGDPSALAQLTGVPVVGDFRIADMAWGGQGAPLVPYLDYVAFRHPMENRLLLNLGGIANLTVLPAGCESGDVVAFDTGPANMVLDLLAQDLLGKPFDAGGSIAASGEVHEPTLRTLLEDNYFALAPPKSTGREHFGRSYANHVRTLLARHGCDDAPTALATVAELTARSIGDAWQRFVSPMVTVDRAIVAGGGAHNEHLMRRLREQPGIPGATAIDIADDNGLTADSKEAVCFAVLAHEFLNGVPTNMPSVTGASRATLLGKLCLPAP